MANLTISVDRDILKQARIRALEENTSVNAILSGYLQKYAGADKNRQRRQKVLENLLKIADEAKAGSAGKKWSRAELYER